MICNLEDAKEQMMFTEEVNRVKFLGLTVKLSVVQLSVTDKQRNAVHSFCRRIAEAYTSMGHTYDTLSFDGLPMEMPFTMELVKQVIWHRTQFDLFRTSSIKDLTRKQVETIEQTIGLNLANQGIDVPFISYK